MGSKIVLTAIAVLGLASLSTGHSAAVEPARSIATEDYVKIEVRGTLRTSIMAIGGETTGTTVSAKGMAFEVDLGKAPKLQATAEKLDGQKAIVRGTLEGKKGVEIRERWIITPSELEPAATTKVK